MSRLLYLDCFSGISGDMVLGALIDAGLPLQDLRRALGSLAMAGCDVGATRVLRAGLSATRFVAHENHESPLASHHSAEHQSPGARAAQSTPHQTSGTLHDHEHGHDRDHGHDHDHLARNAGHGHEHPHRTLPEIFALIDRSALSRVGRDRAKGLFRRLAEAEAAIHQTPAEMVHLHEVGALDSIIDIVGAVFALEWLNADRIVCSPLNVGGGTVRSAHGEFPVPAPATVKLLGDAPIYGGTVQKELVTPTGALIATAYASSFGPVPARAVEQVGYGAGERDHPDVPN